ncbi:hypothetical protein SPRG_15412, partial [Saprolegnia parasitica CBS 223.65]
MLTTWSANQSTEDADEILYNEPSLAGFSLHRNLRAIVPARLSPETHETELLAHFPRLFVLLHRPLVVHGARKDA